MFGGRSRAEIELTEAARLLLGTFEDITKLVAETPDFSVANLPASLLSRLRAEAAEASAADGAAKRGAQMLR